MHIARAPAAGTGKSYLFDIMSAIVNGDRCPVVPAGKDEEEMEKRLSSEILAGHQIICLGNKNGVLSGELLCSILTQKTVKPRILSKSQTPAVSNVFCIFADGNNIAVSQDLIRRVLFSVMDAKLDEKDVLKRTFDSDPVAMVLADRGKYIAACLTILRAHALAGYPGAKDLRPLVGFDDWTRVVRGALVWLGKADPVKSLEVGRASDPEHAEQEAFIEALAGLQAFNKATALTVADIIKVAYTGSDMREALEQFVGFKGVIDAVAVGKWLARFKDKTFGAQQLKSASAGKGKHKWYLQEIAPF